MTIAGRSVPVRTFAIQALSALVVFTTLVFVGIFWRTQMLVRQSLEEEASSTIDLIVDVRAWNAMHGGVWVHKTESAPTNPYLRSLGVEADTRTAGGTELTLRNPAAMTSEISRISDEDHRVTFRLTSLSPVNPGNAPDPWERAALQKFATDRSDALRVDRTSEGGRLRVMRPLMTEKSCLRCHGKQGYHVGDVRGAISVSIPLDSADDAVRTNALWLGAIYVVVLVAGGTLSYALYSRMASRVNESEDRLRRMATTDELTRISNRRAVLERLGIELARGHREHTAVGVLSIDVDHFKQLNDTHGHAVGDLVLREIAARLQGPLREYDVVGRTGGEEFLVIAPDVDSAGLAGLAERLRAAVADEPIARGDLVVRVTVSVGATSAGPLDDADSVLDRADSALYGAKDAGRNRAVTY